MRVTNNMITNTVAFNTHRSIARFLEMQTQMSSGRRINNPSDDPVGTIRDLDYRAELSKNLQYRGAIDLALNWMGIDETELSFTKLLSNVEDADLMKPLTELATFENSYQAALKAGAKIVQPTLLDFLR